MPNKQFLNRMRQALRPDSTSLVRFITEETTINLKPFSFHGHEFQQYITELVEKDPNIDLSVEKASQMGISEVFFRITMGLMALTPGYSIIYAMPTRGFSQEVLKTRMSPIIDGSKILRNLISKDVDSASVKMFTNGSILYALGASSNSSTSLINRPITLALTDELDKCDTDTVTGFRSRQTHSAHKPRIAFSTPTAPGIGINAQADGRQLHYQITVCIHCQHEFIPDYYEQVAIPGYDDLISNLTVEKVRSLDLNTDKAYHFCPKCHAKVSTHENFRHWIVENPQFRKIHVRLSPFSAPYFISIPDLVVSQLTYSSRAEFDNQSLGLPSQLSEVTIARDAIAFTNDDAPSGIPIAGLDLGRDSHYMRGIMQANGQIFVDLIELIPVAELENQVSINLALHKIVSMVSDSLPFLDTVHKLTEKYSQFWGAIYTTPANPRPELYNLKMGTEEAVRQINIQKNMFMDHVAGMIVSGEIIFKHGPMDETIIQHFTDMRRVRDYRFQDIRYKWVKSAKGVDHLFHTLIYLVAASKIIQKSSMGGYLPLQGMLKSFKAKKDI